MQMRCVCSCRPPSYSTAAGGGEGQQQGKVPPKHQRLLDVMLGAQTGGWVKKELGLETCAPAPLSSSVLVRTAQSHQLGGHCAGNLFMLVFHQIR
jgi:hypothetical protein